MPPRDGNQTPPVLARTTRLLLLLVVVVANLVGASVVLVLTAWVLPGGSLSNPDQVLVTNLVALAGYLGLAVPLGSVWGWRRVQRSPRRAADSTPAEQERHVLLHGPLRLVTVQVVLWAGAVVVFTALNATFSLRLAVNVGITTALGGTTICAVAYLLSQRTLRPAAARALTANPPTSTMLPGVAFRALLFWALGTAVPVVGIQLAAAGALTFTDITRARLAIIVLVLGGVGLLGGLLTTVLAARATADPVRAVVAGLRRVERGELDFRVAVYDGTELGVLQAGFNRMVEGLGERERIRDLFGRQVGRDVARRALEGGMALGGEIREVAVLFVDLVGSTELAVSRPPTEVVDLLNAYFGVVVEEVEAHGGWINKFTGDAALAVFGAPTELPDAAGAALATGRCLAERLAVEAATTPAGIGIAAGTVVAGNIGTTQRFEYTVIGDPVNEAARLTELAKSNPSGAVASGAALERADPAERVHWTLAGTTKLRGRDSYTAIAMPHGD